MECKRCGKALVRGTKFCPYCGGKVEGYCPECGAEVELSVRYCSESGNSLKDPWISMDLYKNEDPSLLYYLGIDEFITKIKKKDKSQIVLISIILLIGGWWFAGFSDKEPLNNSDSYMESSEIYSEGELEQDEEFSQEIEKNEKEKNNGYSETQQMTLIDNNEYILPESSQRYLTVEELERFNATTLRLARNEIYARHGRSFQTEDLNAYFSTKSWYHGYLSEEEFDDSVFNVFEKANLELIRFVETGGNITKIPVPNPKGEYILSNSNTAYLTITDLQGLDKETLRLARNEIYARHGRIFQSEDLNRYFSSKSWYYGYLSAEEFDDSVFNVYEKANLELIQQMELK